jgi:hypothetical protein
MGLGIVPDNLDVGELGRVLAMLWRDKPRAGRRERHAKGPFHSAGGCQL